MPPIARRALVQVERELSRIGLLFQHDALRPSFTGLAAGGPVRGSWWGHPRGHELYEALQLFCRGPGQLCVKLVDGKLTFVHRRLWPALLAATRDRSPRRRQGLSPTARRLQRRVARAGQVRADWLRASGFAPRSELAHAIVQLETRLLVHADEVHTESGRHAKQLQSWAHFCRAQGLERPAMSAAAGRAELEAAAHVLTRGCDGAPRLPW